MIDCLNKFLLTTRFFYKSIKLFIIILCVVILSKNIDRIFKNFKFIYIDYPWPKKNSSDIFNKKVKQKIVIHNNQFLYFKTEDDLCYYNKSPCTHKTLDKKIIKGKVLKYYDKFEVDNKSE